MTDIGVPKVELKKISVHNLRLGLSLVGVMAYILGNGVLQPPFVFFLLLLNLLILICFEDG